MITSPAIACLRRSAGKSEDLRQQLEENTREQQCEEENKHESHESPRIRQQARSASEEEKLPAWSFSLAGASGLCVPRWRSGLVVLVLFVEIRVIRGGYFFFNSSASGWWRTMSPSTR